jgi:phosphomannomutase
MSVLIANIGQSGPLTCFKACDVRGELGVNFDAAIAYRIGCAVAEHSGSGTVVWA